MLTARQNDGMANLAKLTVRLPPALNARLTARAQREDLSKNQIIVRLVREFVQDRSTPACGAAEKRIAAR